MLSWGLRVKQVNPCSAFLCGVWLAAGFGAQMVEARAEDNSLASDNLVAKAEKYEDDRDFRECGRAFIVAAQASFDPKDHAQRL